MRLILFDIDGTLIDSGGAGVRALDSALKELFSIENGFHGISMAGKTDPLECSAEPSPVVTEQKRADITFDDFERGTYKRWNSAGTAFGTGPVEISRIPAYQGDWRATENAS